MALSPGEKLGPYEIAGKIGQGGMGEVYRATDTKLGRDVAIKILPAAMARDPERLARFEREARVLAALNHPNIATIYGLEETESGAKAIVMELVEGPTLADRLQAGPLELKEAIAIALAIADALEAAHDKGVVHRDLKPANVKAAEEGIVKVLDLGLATALPGSEREPADGQNSPTLTMGATQAGVIMGTAAYMSPEQASGKRVDKRADIWSFGVVLWEMLTGKRLFEGGETISHTLADVLRAEIKFDQVKAPAPVVELLKRCLDRDVKTRLRDIGEARILLQSDVLRAGASPSGPRAIARYPLGRPFWAASALAILFAAGGLWAWLRPRPTEAKPVIRFRFASQGLNINGGFPLPSLSHEGSIVAYRSDAGKPILIRRIDQFEEQPVPGSEGGANPPCFSPDSQWIAFSADGGKTMKKMRLSGGGALTLAEGLNQADVCDWGEDGNIYFGFSPGIMRVPASGGKAELVAQPDPKKNEFDFELPQLLPGAKLLLFNSSAQAGAGDQLVTVLNLETHEKKTLLEKVGFARYAPTAAGSGHLVYWRNGSLFGVPFDLGHLTVGSPSPVAEGVSGVLTFGFFSFSDSGTLAYEPGGSSALFSGGALFPTWVDRQGAEQAVSGIPSHLYNSTYAGGMQLSPDGKQVVLNYLDLETGTSDIWLFDFVRTTFTKNTFGGAHPAAVWSPDGKRLIYWATERASIAKGEMKSASADGSGQPETLVANDLGLYPGSISPDGKSLLGDQVNAFGEPGNAFALPLEGGDRKPKLLFGTQFNQHGAIFSPDGHWIAYTSNESGGDQVYVIPYPGPGGKRQVSTNGGAFPRWNRNGRELFYREGTKLMAVDVETGAAFRPGTPKMLFDKPYPGSYDVAPDGKRFLMFKNAASSQGQQASELRVVVNWFEELRQRAPAR